MEAMIFTKRTYQLVLYPIWKDIRVLFMFFPRSPSVFRPTNTSLAIIIGINTVLIYH